MRSADGEILAPDLNYLTLFAGKAPLANQVALEEIFGGFGDAEPVQRDLIRKEIVNSLQAERFGFILLQYEGKVWDSVVDYYQCSPLSEVIDAKSLPLAVKAYQVCSPKTGPVE